MKLTSLLPLLAGAGAAQACLTPAERAGGHIARRTTSTTSNNTNSIPVGKGDRFRNGASFPRGIGTQPTASFTTILNLIELRSAIKGLAKEYGIVPFETPYKTAQHNTIYGAKLGNTTSAFFHVLLQAGIHARERGGPDTLLYFIGDLLYADKHQTGLTYGGVSYTLDDVHSALLNGLVILPALNPDGIAYDQATNACWRKNRNPASAKRGNPSTIGVDLNRNFAPVWDFTHALAPGIQAASTDPASEIFAGTGPLSEPEAKNVDWVMDGLPNLGWLVDIHQPAGVVLHGWCHDTNQATDPTQNLLNPAYDGKRGVVPDVPGLAYKEYKPLAEWDVEVLTAGRMAGAMTDATGRPYEALQGPHLYPSSGCSADHGNWRAAVNTTRHRVHGFGVEVGAPNEAVDCPFYPTVDMHRLNIIDTSVALMEALLSASRHKW
ncbi:zinc carboxypeptidase [Cercophora scortea]|uniref:Zinc carboxypeptidase n=1 Tax=Cercophora scortea TaxID=314031 RepID=A0AAE0J2A1_9PEZI|nr:zinc carboxypeptidase [Cercophora scortea]